MSQKNQIYQYYKQNYNQNGPLPDILYKTLVVIVGISDYTTNDYSSLNVVTVDVLGLIEWCKASGFDYLYALRFGVMSTRNNATTDATAKQNEYGDCCVRVLTLLKDKLLKHSIQAI